MYILLKRLLATHWLCLVLLLNCGSATSQSSQTSDSVAVISSANLSELSPQQLKNYLVLKQKLLPNKQRVKIYHLPFDDSVTKKWARSAFNLYPYQLQRIWDRQVFSGRAQIPKKIDNESNMIERLANTPNAIGYISADSPLLKEYKGKVNVIAVF